MAAVLRIEKVRLDRNDGISKVVGTVLCVAGASVITLYKGPTIYTPAGPTVHQTTHVLLALGDANGKSWTLGCIYLIGHCLSWSGWLVLQAPVLKKYPARLSVTSYTCFFGLIQFLVIASFFERDLEAWKFNSGAELFSILYAGVVASGIAFAVQIWCIDKGGPVFVAVYQPVQTLVVAIMASFALGEQFYLGGITANQGFYLLGLDNTTPTFASAVQNSVPALTFLMAAVLRIEKVRLDRNDGISKVVGTVLCVAGASVITLYKGPTIYTPAGPTVHQTTPVLLALGDANGKSWTLGCIYLIGHCLSWSGWLVLQAPVLKKYPARLSVTSYTCFFGLIQFLVIASFFERDLEAWKFNSGAELFSILYAGVVASGIAFAVQIWCIDKGGPVFVAVYQPVQTLVVAIMASFALGEQFYFGGIFGAALIITGLNLVLWGKSQEAKFAKAAILLSPPGEGNSRTLSHSKSGLTQPLLPPSTEHAV